MKFLVLVYCFALAAALSAQEVQRFTFNLGDSFAQPVGNKGRHLAGWNTQGGAGVDFPPWLGLILQAVGINPATLKNPGLRGGNVPVLSTAFDPFAGPFLPVVGGKPRVNLGGRIARGAKWYGRFYAELRYDSILVTSSHHADNLQVSFGFRW
jgi:hypothetical protein